MSWRWVAVLLVCACAAGSTTFALVRATAPASARKAPSAARQGPLGPNVIPTLAEPFPATPDAKQVSMTDAASAFGAAITLPDTAKISPSDVGQVWLNQAFGEETQTTVRLTFPSQGLIINYYQPAMSDPLAYFKANTGEGSASKLIWLGSTPAAYNPGTPDYWAVVEFVVAGTRIDVLGHTSEASLEAVAQSIVDRAATTG